MIGRGTSLFKDNPHTFIDKGCLGVVVLSGMVFIGVICMQALSHLWRLADVEQAEGFEGKHKK
ncbi:hypothetical protein NC653_037020 [Populus alba x Populus x berolinensis]|uniref:Uncharacterized protein n=1 Tax=Populus alba x Populus x berolinensis TaxID=444605 RepID=A0AAD6LLM9_9ROSI|nr:hypothetical protein NC653_037020 [Populus alba x Populus x berolinensis]